MNRALTISTALILLALLEASAEREGPGPRPSCGFETQVGSRRFVFDLSAPVAKYPHGVRSEDGYYKVVQNDNDGLGTTFWFQLCEHMKFNSEPPDCRSCPQSCGGPDHCGETCSALKATRHNGYSLCTTVASSHETSYALIDAGAPSVGVAVNMSLGDSINCPEGVFRSLTVHVICAPSDQAEIPTRITEYPHLGSCQYVTDLKHPSGCPVVTSTYDQHFLWAMQLLLLGVGSIMVYLSLGAAYRSWVLGATGIEAIPHVGFWRAVHEHIKAVATFLLSHLRRLVAPSSYTQLE